MALLPCAPMLISDFDYALPQELIARYPAADRRGSRLLRVGEDVADLHFSDLPSLLRAGDLLVFNDTRVIKARLKAAKDTGGRAEILIERVTGERHALAHVRASKSPKPGSRLLLDRDAEAVVTGREGELFALRFSIASESTLSTLYQGIGSSFFCFRSAQYFSTDSLLNYERWGVEFNSNKLFA